MNIDIRKSIKEGKNMKRVVLLGMLLLAGCQNDGSAWLGYGEGDYAMIGAPQAGWVTSLSVERGQTVKKGDLLFTLDDTSQRAAHDQAQKTLDQAKALLAQEQANLKFTQKELERQQDLVRANAGSVDALDQAENNARQSEARIAQLQAQIGQMEASLQSADYALSQRKIVALTDGTVEDVYFRPGEYVATSTSVVEILPPANVFVRFFVPETKFAKIHLGQKVRISCDNCQPTEATVTFIANQQEYTPPVIFSIGTREKLVFKVEARAPGGLSLHPGQPVDVRPL